VNEELRQYYFIVERPVGSQIWTFAAMACEQEAHCAALRAVRMWKECGHE
jgi:hypothetical protein